MAQSAFRASIVIFWLLMNALLLCHEVFPGFFSGANEGYRTLFRNGPLILDNWMQIECSNQPVGYTHTWVDSSLDSGARRGQGGQPAVTVRNQTFLNLNLLGRNQAIAVTAEAFLDNEHRLQKFAAAMSSSLYGTRVEGVRVRGDVFTVDIETQASRSRIEMSVPADAVLYSPMVDMALRDLAPGRTLRLKTLDPLSLSLADVEIRAVRRETVQVNGVGYETTLLNITCQGMSVKAWIDGDGRLLREETPFGWVMRASSPREILNRRRQAYAGADMAEAMAARVRGRIDNPRDSKSLYVRLNGDMSGLDSLASHRQTVVARLPGGAAEVRLAAQQAPAKVLARGSRMPEDTLPFLISTPGIQSDHDEVKRLADKIVGNQTNCFGAAMAINEWVFRNVAKQPTISMPSALDVLHRREGDCNEHTYLFTALARASGLPTRIIVGIVYTEDALDPAVTGGGAFYYHAWPAVYVGEWVEMDPTFGTPTVDAAYIGLVTGEIKDQMKIIGTIGRLTVDILDETQTTGAQLDIGRTLNDPH